MPDTRRSRDDDDDELRRRARKLLDDSDLVRDYSEAVHEHMWRKTWQRITSTVGKWLLVAIASGIAGRIVVYGVQSGWFK